MILCPNPDCKAKNEDGVLYCDQCGADISQVEPQPEKAQTPIVQPEETEAQPAEEESDAAALPTAKTAARNSLLIVVLVPVVGSLSRRMRIFASTVDINFALMGFNTLNGRMRCKRNGVHSKVKSNHITSKIHGMTSSHR